MKQEVDNARGTDTRPSEQRTTTTALPLHKTYFDDATLSDLTISLSNRSVHVHRIVLCRGSEYFASLVAGHFQESEVKEIKLHDDDPEAMVALLRYLYGVPYATGRAKSQNASTLLPHALVYMTAEKYQVKALQTESCDVMSNALQLDKYKEQHTIDRTDLLAALRTVLAGTPSSDTRARRLLVNHCVQHLRRYFKSGIFKELVAELPELGAELIVHLFDADGDIKPVKNLASTDGDGEVCKTCDRRLTNEEPAAIVVVLAVASTFAFMLLCERFGPITWILGVCFRP